MGTTSRVCTSCDTPVPDDAAFCPNCGEATPTDVIDDERIDQQRLSAALRDHYSIQRELGRGGMAAVYLAQDVKHDRQVAVKVMLPQLAATLGARRFLQEIQVAAKLQHPHIVPLHDSGEADGFLYCVMPYVEGESLRARLRRDRQMPIDESLRITREVAEGLDYAHETGVVHRDIKPENILLSRGHALVADFGIAKAVSSAGGSALTSTGISIGTPAYMSPEQAGGDPNIDHRADIYSLGCVLYEMLAGEPPFTGPNVQAIMAKHAVDARPSARTVRDTVPESVDQGIKRAMAKAPIDRYSRVSAFSSALVEKLEPGGPRTSRAKMEIPVGQPHAARARVGRPWGARIRAALVVTALLGVVVGIAIVKRALEERRTTFFLRTASAQGLYQDTRIVLGADGLQVGRVRDMSPVVDTATNALAFVGRLTLNLRFPDGTTLQLPRGISAEIVQPNPAAPAVVVLVLPDSVFAPGFLEPGDTILARRSADGSQ